MCRRDGVNCLSLLKIQSEPDLSRVARIAIESMRLGKTGCDLNSRRSTLIEIEKPSDTSILTRRRCVAIDEQEPGTNQAASRSYR